MVIHVINAVPIFKDVLHRNATTEVEISSTKHKNKINTIIHKMYLIIQKHHNSCTNLYVLSEKNLIKQETENVFKIFMICINLSGIFYLCHYLCQCKLINTSVTKHICIIDTLI